MFYSTINSLSGNHVYILWKQKEDSQTFNSLVSIVSSKTKRYFADSIDRRVSG